MIEIKICLTESSKGLNPDEIGLAVELATVGKQPAAIEKRHADAVCDLLKVYFEWTSTHQCCRFTHIDGAASQETIDQFINAMGVGTIAQREAKKK